MAIGFNDILAGDTGAGVKDVQQRLNKLDLLSADQITSEFDSETGKAIEKFCEISKLPLKKYVDEIIWKELVDATYSLGDRTLYLRMPFFKGSDCKELQQILGALGFSPGEEDGIFGKTTENALRIFQQNMGLPSDGIVGAFTYQTIKNLHHSWEGKQAYKGKRELGLARVAEVLESNTICLFGTCDFTRSIAKRMSNLSIATTPQSKVVSAEALSVPPNNDMILLQIVLDKDAGESDKNVVYSEEDEFVGKLEDILNKTNRSDNNKISVSLQEKSWSGSKEERSAQHYAINLLDSLCSALSRI